MNKQKLIDILEASDVQEVFIKNDNVLHDFDIEDIPEQFDGFDEFYPQTIAFVSHDD